MAAFFQGLTLFLLGTLCGAGGILFFSPSFEVVVRRADTAIKPMEFAPPVLVPPEPVAPVAVVPPVNAPRPARPVIPIPPSAPASEDEVVLDFAAISRHLIVWPGVVSTKGPTTVVVMADGKKVRDLPLAAGTPLQLTKVLADGTLEVRAQGAKFEIKSGLTDFTARLALHVAELIEKGTAPDAAPLVAATAGPPPASPVPAAATVVPVTVAPKGPLTMAERVKTLYGQKPAEAVPASPAPPAPPPSPPVPRAVEPPRGAEPADPKQPEKDQDLNRKLNQLFR